MCGWRERGRRWLVVAAGGVERGGRAELGRESGSRRRLAQVWLSPGGCSYESEHSPGE